MYAIRSYYGDGTCRVVGMEGGEHQMTCQRRLDGNLGGFRIADLPDENDIGVLPDDRPQAGSKGEIDFGVDLHLSDTTDPVFDRILDSYNFV